MTMSPQNENLASAKQSRGITGLRAVAFVAIMLLAYVVGAMFMQNPAASEHFFSASLFLAAAVWGISHVFPAGWFNMKRTVLLAVILYGGLLGFVLVGPRH
jgi:hypothetical protein